MSADGCSVQPQVTAVIAGSPEDHVIRSLVAQAARIACTEYCSRCDTSGGNNGRLCRPGGIHYCRVLAAHITGKISDNHLIAVQITLGSPAPIPETLLNLEPWQV